MKIQFLLPFFVDSRTTDYLRRFLPADVDIVGIETGRTTETVGDTAFTMHDEIRAIVKAEKDGYDAVLVGCYLDPGVREARELVNIPVVGVCNLSLHICSMLGHRITILAPSEAVRKGIQWNLKAYGFEDNTSVRVVNYTVQECLARYEEYKETGKTGDLIEKLVQECILAIREDDAGVLTIGCGGLLWTVSIVKEELRKKGYDIPFVSSHPAAVEAAKAIVKLGLTHSRLSYPKCDGGP